MLGRLFKQNPTNTNTHYQPHNQLHSHGHPHYHSHHQHSHHQPPTTLPNGLGAQPNSSAVPPPIISPTCNNFDDSYSREILYGTHDAEQLKPYQFNTKYFRIIISQDGGNLRSKQVLYDSATETHSPSSSTTISTISKKTLNTRNISTSKMYHNVSDLNDYMFGCGLPSNETHSTTKIHILPPVANSACEPYDSVLITRLFSISDLEVSERTPLSALASKSNDWTPTPGIASKESNAMKYPFKQTSLAGAEHASSPSKSTNNINSRFAIGIVVSLESMNSVSDVIFNNWNEISHYLIILQKLVYKKLMILLNLGFSYDNHNQITSCQYLINKRIQFPNYILHGDFDINAQLNKLIKLIHYNYNLPKLINSNYLIRSSMLNESKYNPMLINWVLEVLNWLEFKDGKPMSLPNYNYNSSFHYQQQNTLMEYAHSNTNTFLSSLLALLIPCRNLISIKPYANVDSNSREITRVVVMTGNPVVAKKLIFILNAMIPIQKTIEMSPFLDSCYEGTFGGEAMTTQSSTGATAKAAKEEEFASKSTSATPNATSNGILPIPIKFSKPKLEVGGGPASPLSCSDNSSTPSIKWEIPNKSSASTPTTNKSRVESSSLSIPIVSATTATTATPHVHSSFSKGSSAAYLSSSLNSSYSSSLQSNYSLSKIGGSFMEKWKNQFGSLSSHFPNVSNPATSIHTPNNMNFSNNATGYFDTVSNIESQYGSLSKKNSMQSLRSPSPAVEADEFNWHSSSKPINIGSANNDGLNNNGSSMHSQPISMTPNKLSRTQSIYDMYNVYNMNCLMNVMDEEELVAETMSEGTSRSSNIGTNGPTAGSAGAGVAIHKSLEIKRSKTSVFTPLINCAMVKNVDELNQHAIRMKCKKIMNTKPKVKANGHSLEVNDAEEEGAKCKEESDLEMPERDEDDIVFKHRALLSSVAFSDEFRPEFSIQSCPVNPKLEQQVMNTMRNDLLFYQNNSKYEAITTRTIFISLRAREIKLIEMNLQNPTTSTSPNETSTAMNGYFDNHSINSTNGSTGIGGGSSSRRNSVAGLNKSYKTKIRKIYTPMKNLGDRELINRIEFILDEINQLFSIQQQLYHDKKKSNGKEFHDKLSKLVLSLLE